MANVTIIESLIPSGTMSRIGEKREKKWIVIHETGNRSAGAGAKNHAKYLQSVAKANNQYYSWHYTVDDKEIYRHIPDEEVAFHAGDGSKLDGGNYAGIGIEICVNPESNFSVAVDNAASLTADLLKKHQLGLSAVKQHHDFSSYGKNCPETIRNNGLWAPFLQMVSEYVEGKGKGKGKGDLVEEKQLLFKQGETVELEGYVYADSYAGRAGQKFSHKLCVITRVADANRAAPYLLDNGLGWAKEQDLAYPQSTQPRPVAEGSRVRVNGNLYTNSYGGVPVRAISGLYNVTMLLPERPVGVLIGGNLGWVRVQDCVRVD